MLNASGEPSAFPNSRKMAVGKRSGVEIAEVCCCRSQHQCERRALAGHAWSQARPIRLCEGTGRALAVATARTQPTLFIAASLRMRHAGGMPGARHSGLVCPNWHGMARCHRANSGVC